MTIDYATLTQRKSDVDLERIRDIRALFEGGKLLDLRIDKLIPKGMSDDAVVTRKKRSLATQYYRNYLANAINYYADFLFSYPISIRATDLDGYTVSLPDYISALANDCDGNQTDLHDMMKGCFKEAANSGFCFWAVEFPAITEDAPEDLEAFEKLGFNEAIIRPFDAEEVLDWDCDELGALLWVKTCQVKQFRKGPLSSVLLTQETYRIYDREAISTLVIEYDSKKPPKPGDQFPNPAVAPHRFPGEVPMVCLQMQPGHWLGNNLRTHQIANLHAVLRVAWLAGTIAFAVPVINSDSPDIAGMFGTGYAIKIGQEDKYSYSIPAADCLDIQQDIEKKTKDELFRCAGLNFLGVDNNSMGLVRSARSRAFDADIGHTQLKSFASAIRTALEKTLSFVARGRGEDSLTFSAEDFEQLDSYDLDGLVKITAELKAVSIPSPTLMREMYKEISAHFGNDLSEHVKEQIRREIDSAPDEQVLAPIAPDDTKELQSELDNPGKLPRAKASSTSD